MTTKVKEVNEKGIEEKIMEVVVKLQEGTDDRRFTIMGVFHYCLQRGILKDFHTLEDILQSLRNKDIIYNVGGGLWVTPKPKRNKK